MSPINTTRSIYGRVGSPQSGGKDDASTACQSASLISHPGADAEDDGGRNGGYEGPTAWAPSHQG